MWKETVVAYPNVIFRNVPGGCEETQKPYSLASHYLVHTILCAQSILSLL
jgi:hypothetical protein